MSAATPRAAGTTSSRRGQPKYGVYPLREVPPARTERAQSPEPSPAPLATDAAINALASAFAQVIDDVTRRQAGAAAAPGGMRVTGTLPGEPQQLLVRLPAAAAMLGVGVTVVKDLIRRGELVSIRVNTCRLVPVAVIEDFIAEQVERAREAIARGEVPGL